MFNSKNKRVVFATGILLVLTLTIFSSLVAVAWMSMNNAMVVSADSYTYDFAAEGEVALASRLGNDAPVLHSRIGNDVPVLHSRIDPGIVSSVDYKDYVIRIDYKEYIRSSGFKDSVSIARFMGYKGSFMPAASPDGGRISDYISLWQMIRTTH